jgi:hypothetical protein
MAGLATAAATDSIAPSVSFATPSVDGALVTGTVHLTGNSSDNAGVPMMRLYVNGALKSQSGKGYIAYPWDSSTVPSGSVNYIKITAWDAAGNLSQVTRQVIKK